MIFFFFFIIAEHVVATLASFLITSDYTEEILSEYWLLSLAELINKSFEADWIVSNRFKKSAGFFLIEVPENIYFGSDFLKL